MSRTPINRSPDLKRLEDDGYEIEIVAGHLVLHNVLYVDSKGKIRRGTLVSTLDLSDDKTLPPSTHVCMFAGDESNVEELRGFDFVFLCMDGKPGKEAVVRKLEEFGVPFVDSGMGIEKSDDGLRGVLRLTTSTPVNRSHVWEKHPIPFSNGKANDIYTSNIQVADLNALNAVLAVIRWKKYFGFYADLEGEHFVTYTIDGNAMTNEDQE